MLQCHKNAVYVPNGYSHSWFKEWLLCRLMHIILQHLLKEMKIQATAFWALYEVVGVYFVKILEDLNLCSIHVRCIHSCHVTTVGMAHLEWDEVKLFFYISIYITHLHANKVLYLWQLLLTGNCCTCTHWW